jgi:hypothetical protein
MTMHRNFRLLAAKLPVFQLESLTRRQLDSEETAHWQLIASIDSDIAAAFKFKLVCLRLLASRAVPGVTVPIAD